MDGTVSEILVFETAPIDLRKKQVIAPFSRKRFTRNKVFCKPDFEPILI
jgi:hypothetical protein